MAMCGAEARREVGGGGGTLPAVVLSLEWDYNNKQEQQKRQRREKLNKEPKAQWASAASQVVSL